MAHYEAKKERIKELLKLQDEIESELRSLLEPERVKMLPPGFSVSTEVFNVILEVKEEGISSKNILKLLQKRFPSFGIDREKVASALAYLKNSKQTIEQTNRGVYRLKTETPNSREQGAG